MPEHARPTNDHLSTWLDLLFRATPGRGEAVELRAIHPDRGKRAHQHWIILEDPSAVSLKRKLKRGMHIGLDKIPDLIAELEREGFNVYAGVATRARKGGTKQDLGSAGAAWTDLDDRPEMTPDNLISICEMVHDIPPPSMVVHSGGGLHAYWLLDEPLDLTRAENIAKLEAINQGIAHLLGGDKAFDAPRILRPPGTVNRPGPEKRAQGRVEAPVRLLYADGERRYSLDDLAAFEEAGGLCLLDEGKRSGAEPLYERRDDDGELPKRVRKVIERDDRVRARFEGDDSGLRDATDSGIDASLASLLVLRGCIGWEVEAALRRSREERGTAKSPEEKGNGYFVRTVNRALALAGGAKRRSAQEAFNVAS